MMGNRSEFLYAWFGILKLAAIEVPIHDAARGPGISHILNVTDAKVLIVEDTFVGHVLPYLSEAPSVEHLVVVGEQPADANGGVPIHDFADLRANPSTVDTIDVAPHQPASILFTGGTTGPPKGVVLPHNRNIEACHQHGRADRLHRGRRAAHGLPALPINAKYMTLVAAMVSGAQAVINRRFSASRFWDQCRREGVTAFNDMGAMLRSCSSSRQARRHAENPVRVGFGAAAPGRARGRSSRSASASSGPRRVRHDRDRPDHVQPLDRRAGSGACRSRGTRSASSTRTTCRSPRAAR